MTRGVIITHSHTQESQRGLADRWANSDILPEGAEDDDEAVKSVKVVWETRVTHAGFAAEF